MRVILLVIISLCLHQGYFGNAQQRESKESKNLENSPQVQSKENAGSSRQRDGKLFSLFAVVTFPNDECTTKSDASLRGTCLSTTECTDQAGSQDGNCAAGFGVCCVFEIAACGGTVSRNCTYVTSPSYPTAYTTASSTCTYTVNYCSTDICALRLDFYNLVLEDPGTAGSCSDTLTVTSPTGRNPPVICATNTGYHMYVETARSTTATTIAVATSINPTNPARTWKIKVSQIECTSLSKPPSDCVQYYTGTSGTATSYAYPTRMLQSQNFATCIRPADGFCSISYSETATTTPDPFSLDIMAITMSETTLCSIAYVEVLLADSAETGVFCGAFFNNDDGMAAGGAVLQQTRPFAFNTVSAGADQDSATGYSLDFFQKPCTS